MKVMDGTSQSMTTPVSQNKVSVLIAAAHQRVRSDCSSVLFLLIKAEVSG